MSPFEKNYSIRKGILDVMEQGGFLGKIESADPEVSRFREFIRRMGEKTHADTREKLHPTVLPIFPGLDNLPIRDQEGDEVVDYLLENIDTIKSEALRLQGRELSFSGGIVTDGMWQIYPMWYMGLDLPFMTCHCPQLKKIIENLPRTSKLYPFSEALLSWMQPNTHLRAHCSVDSLRLRYSVGVIIDDYCALRVGKIKKEWQEGTAIVFEDCYEHEAWNGPKDRLVFIIDTWHPDLTLTEREFIMAGFRKKEVREILYEFRLNEEMRPFLQKQFEKEDDDELIKKYWNEEPKIDSPVIEDWGVWDTVPRFK